MKKKLNYIILNILILLFVFSKAVLGNDVKKDVIVEYNVDSSTLNIYSGSAILIEKETGDILFEKNAYDKMYPASTTKMLTAILVLENSYLNERVKVSSPALASIPSGYVKAPLYEGEEFTVEELLNAMLIPSANDVANVLAEHVSGSVEAFAGLMNQKAEELGLTNSHFTNPSGIHDENLYTTAYDLSILARYAINNDKFMEIVSKTSYTLRGTDIHPENDRILKNSNFLLDSSQASYYYEYATGMKTGFTDQAGDSLVASAKKDDIEFIAVCLHGSTLPNGLREKFLDCKTLFDFAFDNYITYYKDLQAKIQEETLKQEAEALRLQEEADVKEFEEKEFDYNSSRTIAKIVAFLIIIIALKLIFFRKKKNRRKRAKRGK